MVYYAINSVITIIGNTETVHKISGYKWVVLIIWGFCNHVALPLEVLLQDVNFALVPIVKTHEFACGKSAWIYTIIIFNFLI